MKPAQLGISGGAFETAYKRTYPSKNVRRFVWIAFKPQASQRVGNRPASGMFAQDDAVLAPQESGINALIVEAILEQPIDVDASLVRKNAGANEAFLPGDLAPGSYTVKFSSGCGATG